MKNAKNVQNELVIYPGMNWQPMQVSEYWSDVFVYLVKLQGRQPHVKGISGEVDHIPQKGLVKFEEEPIFYLKEFGGMRLALGKQLMSYCAQDVSATHEVFCVLLEKYFDRFPHPVTFAAMLEMGQCYLPLNQNWERYLQDSQETYENLQDEMKILLMQIANENCLYLHDDLYKDDPWLWDLDWSVEKFRLRKKYYDTLNDSPVIEKNKKDVKTTTEDEEGAGEEELAADLDEEELEEERKLEEVRAKLEKTLEFLPKVNQHMAGYPAWYRDLCPRQSLPEFRNSPSLISSQTRVTPKLLRMTWEGYPLHFIAKHGWGFLVPKDGDWVNNEHETDTSTLDDENNIDTEGTDEGSEDQKQFPVRSLRALLAAREKQQRNKRSSEINEDDQEVDDVTKSMKKKRSNAQSPLYNGRKPCIDVEIAGCWFYKLPHKDGGNANVGNPLAKDFLTKIEDGTLSSEGGLEAEKILEINKVISSWRNSSKRILSQMVVHFNKSDLPPKVTRDRSYDDEGMYGAILPRVITGRYSHQEGCGTNMAYCNKCFGNTLKMFFPSKPDRVGSELKAMVQAPPGYHFVGADVDSQELWIAAILGDSNFVGIHGCTALGWMTLQGNKKDATDMHSVTANTVGISRNHAKVINYARIYGAGKKFARHLLMQFNDSLSSNEAWEKAEGIFATTKGEIKYHLLPEGEKLCSLPEVQTLPEIEDEEWVSGEELNKISSWLSQKLQKDDSLDGANLPTEVMMASKDSKFTNILKSLTDKQAWFNGSESHMFNQLEAIANSPEPRTPVLGCRISRALEPQAVNNEFLTSRVNWVVQSSAVDYLHLLLVSTKWLFDLYKIDGRFSISIHDEVRYLVKSEDRYKAALALQIANLLTRCMFAYKLGMNDLPQSVAFFSAMDIDKVLRKEVEMDCVTPSNPHGLERGYNIPKGEALNIHELLERINRGEGATVSKENAQPKVGVK
ncbi:putative DNA polymerase subunit gamma-1-like [Apostichopus japonicus]|uniref:DNA polymerase subunit gamma-1 n=1 Tax=Stichopus japonicus TaxID=307972 RepID=A0A2G8JZK2_STIJA|nr:putative DNA polymerase subunit gamma-1-like [Apostichopus japonicus]